nr:titin isoform X2 [Ciona intestinalis]|eukprot:XP_002121915.1 titin isoform X2 [Ciona intestinalis]
MPVKYSDDDYRRYGNDDYSFSLRSDTSRDYARRRRWGDDDDEAMSQLSSPLRLPKIGQPNRRSYSPFELPDDAMIPQRRSTRFEQRDSPIMTRRRYDDVDEVTTDVTPRRQKYKIPEYLLDSDDEDIMTSPAPRPRYMTSPSKFEDDAEDEQVTSPPKVKKHVEMTSQEKRKRAKFDEKAEAGYTMPVSRRRPDPAVGEEEEAMKDIASYIAVRRSFPVEEDEDIQELEHKKYQYRTRGVDYRPKVYNEERSRDRLNSAPMFDMKLRSHVVWEKMYVKFTCTIRGSPPPRIIWYHNMVPIEPLTLAPGTMKISNQYGVHTLEIFQCKLEDSGTYRISAQNYKGEMSSYATLLVRRYDDSKSGYYDIKSGFNLRKPTDYPDVQGMNIPGYPNFITRLFNKEVNEGDAVVMTCEVDGKPNPEVFWTLNGRNLDTKTSHVRTDFDGRIASLTILKAFTDDEGEYVCRAYNNCGASTSKCNLVVHGNNAPPSAPTCLQYDDVTRNYVVLTWKPPGYTGYFGGAPIEGYFIEKAESGSSVWRMASTRSVRLTTSPVCGLEEGEIYFFRVRAYNRWGRGPASLPVGPVAMRDPGTPMLPLELLEPGSLVPPETDDICVEEEEPSDVPGIPSDITTSLSANGDIVCVRWVAPEGDEIDGYVIEYCEDGSDQWERATSEPLKTTDPYPVTGLNPGVAYKFRVFAMNGAGLSDPSDVTNTIQVGLAMNGGEKTTPEVSDVNEDDDVTNANDATKVNDDVINTDDVVAEEKMNTKYRGPPTPPSDLQSLKVTREFIEVGWTPPSKSGGENVRYFLEYRQLGCEHWIQANHTPIRYTRYPVGELQQGESYMFRVRAVNSLGTSLFSQPSEPILASDGIKPPNWWGGVQGLFRVADHEGKPCVTKKSIKVCWEAPSSDGGSNVTGYYLECRPVGGKFKPVNNKPLTQRHYDVIGLVENEFYQFRLRACNVAGFGEWKLLPGRVRAQEPERPSEPRDVTIADVTEDSVMLEWRRPERMGHGDFIGYTVDRRKEGSDFWIPCNKLPEQVEDEKYKVDGLITGQTYFFRVTAVNQIGAGQTSLQSCYVTPGESWDDVNERQEAVRELWRKKKEIEAERIRRMEEEERREAFASKMKDCYVTEGGQGYFECRVKDARTKVTWYLGNWKEVEIKPEGKYDVISRGKRRSLIVNNCSSDDVQAVHCVASYNGCTSTADLVVGNMEPVHFVRAPVNVFLTKGQTAIFDCLLSKPNPIVSWSKNDITINESDDVRYEFITQGCGRSLIINDVTPDDVAMYEISGLGGKYTVNLVVDGVLPVKFDKKLDDSSLPHDVTMAQFECMAVPSPLHEGRIPAATWFHNGEVVEADDERYELVAVGNNHVLKIINPTYEDNGEIVCVIDGGSTRCLIDIEKPPPPPPKPARSEDYIINFEQGLRAEPLPNALRLFCIVTKLRDDAHIIWYQNNKEIVVDNQKYKCFNDQSTGLVSLVITPIHEELERGKFTCEFITPLSTFDTKVNFEFENDEFSKILEKSAEMLQEEDEERRVRKEERQKKKEEKKKGGPDKLVIKKEDIVDPIDVIPILAEGIEHGVDEAGRIIIFVQTNKELEQYKVTWLRNSQPVDQERHHAEVEGSKAILKIEEPCVDDAATYTCQMTSSESKCETSADLTGNVFKELLLRSAETRIAPKPECDVTEDSEQPIEVVELVVEKEEEC